MGNSLQLVRLDLLWVDQRLTPATEIVNYKRRSSTLWLASLIVFPIALLLDTFYGSCLFSILDHESREFPLLFSRFRRSEHISAVPAES